MKINIIIVVSIFVALSFVCIGFVSAAEIVDHSPPINNPYNDPLYSALSQEPDDGIGIENISLKLNYWNDRLQWGLSQEQIRQYSDRVGETLLKDYAISDGKWYHIKNLTKFDEELGEYIGLNNDQISQFILEDKKQLVIDRQNYHSPFLESINKKAGSDTETNLIETLVSSDSQSAPGFSFTTIAFAIMIISLITYIRRERRSK